MLAQSLDPVTHAASGRAAALQRLGRRSEVRAHCMYHATVACRRIFICMPLDMCAAPIDRNQGFQFIETSTVRHTRR